MSEREVSGRDSGAPPRAADWARLTALLLAALLAASLALAFRADAFVYWANDGSDTIGRATLNGTAANQGFVVGANNPGGVAVDAAHLYWTNEGAHTIGRANL